MPLRNNQSLGKLGEEIAVKYLQKLGYRILERNFHKRYCELDIVALDKETLVFIEVKTRRGTQYGMPQEAITPFKIRTLIRSAQYYKLMHPNLPDSMRIDAFCLLLSHENKIEDLRLIKNITR